jgi:hypothetical protein
MFFDKNATKLGATKLGKFLTNRYTLYYATIYPKYTSFERELERLMHDPIRLCDGNNENISIKPIKAVRLG